MRSALLMSVAGLLLALASACSAPTENQLAQQSIAAAQAQNSNTANINQALATIALSTSQPITNYQVGPEDLLQITIYNIPASESGLTPRTISTRVNYQGMISLPLLGEIKVAGLTLADLERELVKRYEKYIRFPQVGVLVSEYRQRVSLIGAVQKTGVFQLTGPKTVIEILAEAGGVSDNAGSQVHIYRQGEKGRESLIIDLLDVASNAALINANNATLITSPVQAGDVINVPPAGTYFVDGAVRRPGAYSLGRRYTLTQALAVAGGVDPELNSNEITIYRRKNGSGMEPIAVDLEDVMDGKSADLQIASDDVIVVPMSPGKYFVRRFVGSLVGGMSIGSFIPRVYGS